MTALNELYQSVILDHNRSPQNYRVMADANRQAEGNNPLCGDRLIIWLRLDGDLIRDVSFQGSGCAISKASASLMTSAVKGKTRAAAVELFQREAETLGKLAVFSGVSQFPIRVKCASLSWHAMKAALEQPGETVRTE
jgi:nitrogen fixation NifU-like protein